jgi:hypothetical protein
MSRRSKISKEIDSKLLLPIQHSLKVLRDLALYRYHGGYVWAAIMDDGELMCVACVRANYRQIFKSTRENIGDGWTLIDAMNSGDSEETVVTCAHCNKVIWENEANVGEEK